MNYSSLNSIEHFLKYFIKKTPFWPPLRKRLIYRRQRKEMCLWKKGRTISPPHIIKEKILKEYAFRYGLKIFVETGTYNGRMVESMREIFEYIYTIELDKKLYEKAKNKFAGESHIKVINGDSGSELGKIINNKINQPALFWLDAHYSGGITAKGDIDTPVMQELAHILNSGPVPHVVIIDDARCLGSEPFWPSSDELIAFIKAKKSELDIEIRDDIVRITPDQLSCG